MDLVHYCCQSIVGQILICHEKSKGKSFKRKAAEIQRYLQNQLIGILSTRFRQEMLNILFEKFEETMSINLSEVFLFKCLINEDVQDVQICHKFMLIELIQALKHSSITKKTKLQRLIVNRHVNVSMNNVISLFESGINFENLQFLLLSNLNGTEMVFHKVLSNIGKQCCNLKGIIFSNCYIHNSDDNELKLFNVNVFFHLFSPNPYETFKSLRREDMFKKVMQTSLEDFTNMENTKNVKISGNNGRTLGMI